MLRPLPGDIFQYAEWTAKQKVPSDYHAYINKHYYSVPHHLAQSRVDARVTPKTVEIFHDGKRVACHVRSDEVGGHTTLPEHQPKAHREYANLTPEKLKEWAETIGDAASAVVQYQFREGSSVINGLKACHGLKQLAREYGSSQFEKACQKSLRIGSLNLTSIKSLLKRGLVDIPAGEEPIQINLPLHENVRGSTYYS